MQIGYIAIKYEIIGKAVIDAGGANEQYVIKLLYCGDAMPGRRATPEFDMTCPEDFFNAATVGDILSLDIDAQGKKYYR